ncbi:MAG: glycosyltransferase, partial [Methyloprofundus sp.]|nr:glycosyltransferase [Methyloprofundus sp.]
IEPCLDALENQSYPSELFEVIIVDNGSSDNSIEVLKRKKVKYFIENKRGRSSALNLGVKNSSGTIICTTDISCLAEPDWISNIVKAFQKDPNIGCVAGEIEIIDEPKNNIIEFQKRHNYMSPMHAKKRNKLPYLPFADGANASFKKELFDQIGLFDKNFIKAADVEICYRMQILTPYKIVFDENCLVREPGEHSLYALLKQRYKIGKGTILLQKKFPELFNYKKEKENQLKKFYWKITNKAITFYHFTKNIIFSITNNKAKENAYDQLVIYLMNISQLLGAFLEKYLLKNNYNIKPIESKIIKSFILEYTNK